MGGNNPINQTNSINLKVEELELQLEKNNQKYLRLLAEFDNYKKRVNSDIKEQRKYSGSDIIGSFLAVFDDIHRILEHKDVSDLSKIIEGIELIDNNINNILDNYGITSFDSIGKTFDHNFHEAIAQKSSKEKEGVISKKQLYPNEARLRNLTYATNVLIDIVFSVIKKSSSKIP